MDIEGGQLGQWTLKEGIEGGQLGQWTLKEGS